MLDPDAIPEAECAVLRLVRGLGDLPDAGLRMIAAHCEYVAFGTGLCRL